MEAAEKNSKDLATQKTIWFGKEKENSQSLYKDDIYLSFTCVFITIHMMIQMDICTTDFLSFYMVFLL
jgi:hypothetical protein